MATATFSVRMDENLKSQFENICEEFGMNMSIAINVFARAVVRERKIPFEIAAKPISALREEALEAVKEIRDNAKNNGTADMSMEDILKEIDEYRNGR